MKIKINGKPYLVPQSLRNVPLLDFIRDVAGLKGTKFGCGKGLCGACTVHIDGVASRSCQETTQEVAHQRITTIEGLAGSASPKQLHSVQEAWIEESVPQCGYCQPGQIMTAAAFLKNNPTPSEEDIRDAMDGNLCRCGTYPRIHKAILRAAKERYNANR
ncbi:MAG: (2Fe-2S)-binding protein [Rhodospirillaceae bacterium]|jgi:isoquinoline 1-oxidoreductase subunit alpha|nr:(2Fe-2S)-binding protein [Rhodospirillaceae bacterium]MBT4940958.1 (2Fe-2S)-binding protein [Rhodospirillaceae bacterium]MBT7267539.1 (2Fe-2S)-binding protein [Rhodospirillaceae bacterium]